MDLKFIDYRVVPLLAYPRALEKPDYMQIQDYEELQLNHYQGGLSLRQITFKDPWTSRFCAQAQQRLM